MPSIVRNSQKSKTLMAHFAREVEREMDASGMMYRKVAKAVGLTHSALWKIVRGEAVPRLDTAICLALYFGRSLDNMLTGASSPDPE